jgi:hypothetical protein
MIDEISSYSVKHFISFLDEVYFRMFERQFEAWWPAHLLLIGIGLATLVLTHLGKIRAVAVLLCLPLAASAVTFHFQLYAELTPVGRYFGWAFVAQIPLILIWGFSTQTHARFRPTIPSITGAAIALFGLTIYPLLTLAEESKWRGAEYFGMAPDPTICFVLGILLITARPLWLLMLFPIPLLWAIISSATLNALEAPHSLTLAIAAAIAIIAALWKAIAAKLSVSSSQRIPPGT